MLTAYYPKSPLQIPRNLTGLTSSYQLRAGLAILGILLFFALYFAMVVALGYLVYWAFTYDMVRVNKITILAKIGAIAGSAMLFVFTLKFIFKLKNHKPQNRIKLVKKDNPELWSFVHQICKETGAPKPKSIYIDPDVNAYVSYTNMWLSLFLPVKKDLTIGLGLVSCLNLSEFKAVISHEFGHFAQSSMKIGSYIVSANTIIHDMIFSRDSWDELLDQWRASDFRLSAAAWVITPVIWLIRKMLSLFYQFLNIMHSSLSREMEFNADKVAVSTSGSDAIVSALWKLERGSEVWNETMRYVYLAAQKQVFVKNLYTHNNLAVERVAGAQQQILDNLPEDSRGGKRFFADAEVSHVHMYASHPPNDKREHSAKTPYVPCETDDRSPWLLFGVADSVQEEATQLIYDQYLQKDPKKTVSADVFENFIHAEKADQELLAEYFNTFENRFLNIPDLDELDKQAQSMLESNTQTVEGLKAGLQQLMKPVWEIEELMLTARKIAEGSSKEKSFSFSGKEFDMDTIQEGYATLINKREELFANGFNSWDAEFLAFHLALAKQTGKANSLLDLYKQHTALSEIYRAVINAKNWIHQEISQLQSKEEIMPVELEYLAKDADKTVVELNKKLKALDALNYFSLPNLDSLAEFKAAIVEGGAFQREQGPIFENGGFDRIFNAIENATAHCQRLDQKSIAAILKFHKELQDAAEKSNSKKK